MAETVPLLWASWEPKVANRFLLYLEPAGIPSYLVKAASRPSVDFDDITIDYINQKRRFKGKGTWGDITLTLYDPVTSEGIDAVKNWILLHHDPATGIDGYAADYKKDVQLDTLSPTGEVLETWILHQAFCANVNYGATAFDWASGADPLTIEMTLRYDWATLTVFPPTDRTAAALS